MAKGYLIAQIEIHDARAYQEYGEKVRQLSSDTRGNSWFAEAGSSRLKATALRRESWSSNSRVLLVHGIGTSRKGIRRSYLSAKLPR